MPENRVEDAIHEKLTGAAQKNAKDFVAYMNVNEMPPEWSDGIWICRHQSKPICVIYISGDAQMPGPWTIWHSGYDPKYTPDAIPAGEDADKIGLADLSADEKLKETAWAHINICGQCGCGRQPGRRTVVFGKEFDNVCTSTLAFNDPDAETLEHVKKLAEEMKNGIVKLS